MTLNDKVYINGTLLDLGEAGGVTLEYSVSDPADMAAIYTPGSWTVSLPKSAVNLQAFGFMTEPGVITDAPHIEHACQVIRNGVPLFDAGKLTVIDVTETINVVITWNTNERLTELSRAKLQDLEIDKVMIWDPGLFETSEDDNFKWVVDTGYKSAGADGVMNYNARGFRPAVKASYLLGAMLPGLTIGQAYWDRLENTWLMLPTTNGNAAIDDTLSWRVTGSYSNYDPILNVKDPLKQLTPYVSLEHRYIDLLLNRSATGAQFTQLYVPKDGRYRIFGYVRVASTASGASNYNGKFRIMLNLTYEAAEGGGLTPKYENLYYSEYPIATNNVFDVVVDLQAGDLISMSNEYGLTNATLSGDIGFDLDQAYTENTDTGYLLDYPIRENLPDIGCIEFITGMFGMMGLVAQSNGTGINVFSIDDVINNADSVDISSYINDRESRELQYSYGLTANNRLTYADDTNGIAFAANTYDKAENIVVELPFAAGTDITLYERGENGEFSIKDSEDIKALARSGTRTIKVIDDHWGPATLREISVSVFSFTGLDWAALYATYWTGYKGVFADNQRVVMYKAVIPEVFARSLDFSKPVHDGVNRYMLMKVGEYGYTGACELTLAMLDGVEAGILSGGPVILVDQSVPLMFDTTVVATYAPAGSLLPGKLIRELEETTGPLPEGSMIAVDLGTGEAKKWQPAAYMHSHSNKAFLDLIDQGLSMGSDVKFNSMIAAGAVVAGALNGTLPDDLPVSSPLLYGVSKYDDVTIKINANGQWYVATSGGTIVSFGTEVAGQSIQLIVAAINKTLALAGHTHNYQPLDNDLTAIAALTGTGLLKRTGTDTWALDTNAYLTAITKAMVEAVLIGTITSHQHNYLPINGGNLTGLLTILGQSVWYAGNDGAGSGLDADLLDGIESTNYLYLNSVVGSAFDANLLRANRIYRTTGGCTNLPTASDNSGILIVYQSYDSNYGYQIYQQSTTDELWFRRTSSGTTWQPWRKLFHSGNSNLKTVDWYAKNLYGVNGLFDGAVVAGALNGTLPDDLPVATSALFGVIKTGLSLNNNVGVVNLNGRHYTTTSTYTDAAVREITAELALGTGSMTAGTLDQIQLAFAPLTTTRGLTGNIIATATGAGMSLAIGFRKDTGSGRWYLMVYNGTPSTVVRDGILISIRGQQTI